MKQNKDWGSYLNFTLNPINPNIDSLSAMREIGKISEQYRQSQEKIIAYTVVVYEALSYLGDCCETGLSEQALKDIKQTFENENFTDTSAYKLVANLLDSFKQISTDGEFITKEDFVKAVSIGAIIDFVEKPEFAQLMNMLKNARTSLFSVLMEKYDLRSSLGSLLISVLENMKMDIASDLYSSNISKDDSELLSEAVSYSFAKQIPSVWKSKRYASNPIQDYRTITKEQLKSPIDLCI